MNKVFFTRLVLAFSLLLVSTTLFQNCGGFVSLSRNSTEYARVMDTQKKLTEESLAQQKALFSTPVAVLLSPTGIVQNSIQEMVQDLDRLEQQAADPTAVPAEQRTFLTLGFEATPSERWAQEHPKDGY